MLIPHARRNMRRGTRARRTAAIELTDVTAIQREISDSPAVAPNGWRSDARGLRQQEPHLAGDRLDERVLRDPRLDARARGRMFNDSELLSALAFVRASAPRRRRSFRSSNPLDAMIRVGKMSCTVIGVTASKGQSAMGQDQDDFVLIPMATFQRRMSGTKDVDSILISVNRSARRRPSFARCNRSCASGVGIQPGAEDDFDVRDMKEIADTLSTVTGTLTMLLAGIAAVSLLVGGIGIMNIMLVSVTERTREIGIRLAVGARAIEVLTHFLVESAVLSLFGGAIGIALGLGGSYAATRAFHLPFSFSPSVVAFAFGFSATVGIVFGLPARRAARLKPTEALRHE